MLSCWQTPYVTWCNRRERSRLRSTARSLPRAPESYTIGAARDATTETGMYGSVRIQYAQVTTRSGYVGLWAPRAPSDCSLAASARRIVQEVMLVCVSNRAVGPVARCTDR